MDVVTEVRKLVGAREEDAEHREKRRRVIPLQRWPKGSARRFKNIQALYLFKSPLAVIPSCHSPQALRISICEYIVILLSSPYFHIRTVLCSCWAVSSKNDDMMMYRIKLLGLWFTRSCFSHLESPFRLQVGFHVLQTLKVFSCHLPPHLCSLDMILSLSWGASCFDHMARFFTYCQPSDLTLTAVSLSKSQPIA